MLLHRPAITDGRLNFRHADVLIWSTGRKIQTKREEKRGPRTTESGGMGTAVVGEGMADVSAVKQHGVLACSSGEVALRR
jgi:hypothetical protein